MPTACQSRSWEMAAPLAGSPRRAYPWHGSRPRVRTSCPPTGHVVTHGQIGRLTRARYACTARAVQTPQTACGGGPDGQKVWQREVAWELLRPQLDFLHFPAWKSHGTEVLMLCACTFVPGTIVACPAQMLSPGKGSSRLWAWLTPQM